MELFKSKREELMQMMTAFRPACILGAAAELDLFSFLKDKHSFAEEVASGLKTDLRGVRILLDSLVALELLNKENERYSTPSDLVPLLTSHQESTLLPSIWHSMNILRRWSHLSETVKEGGPIDKGPSIRGEEADVAAFVAAMHVNSGLIADKLVGQLKKYQFKYLLDVGGASGSWTLAFLRSQPNSHATLFDLPHAIKQAKERFEREGISNRVSLVPGDFLEQDFPKGFDFAWVSAIIHMLSRTEIRMLFKKIFNALVPGGHIAIRDIVMEDNRTEPVQGALFAVNMLVGTDQGGTFTLREIKEDLEAVGFKHVVLDIKASDMNSVVVAEK